MKRKTACGVYEYLQSLGLLENGTAETIATAKKKYWATVRNEWKRQRRKQNKCYTIFCTPKEIKMLQGKAKHTKGGVTGFIKHAALLYSTYTAIIDQEKLGKIREALSLHYTSLQEYAEEHQVPDQERTIWLQEIEHIEQEMLQYLQTLSIDIT